MGIIILLYYGDEELYYGDEENIIKIGIIVSVY
jgi:hypothetical protein